VRKLAAGLLIGAGAAAIVLTLNLLLATVAGDGQSFLQSIELKTYDWRLTHTAQPATARQDIALIDIDEYSLRNLEPNTGHWPWPRAVHSMLIDFLARAPAKVIVYDVVFAGADTRSGFPFGGTTWTGAESDRALADSVKTAGNVIVPVDATFEGASAPSEGAPPVPGTRTKLVGPSVTRMSPFVSGVIVFQLSRQSTTDVGGALPSIGMRTICLWFVPETGMIISNERPSAEIIDPWKPDVPGSTPKSVVPIGRVIIRAVVPSPPTLVCGTAATITVRPSGVIRELRIVCSAGIATASERNGVG